LQTPPRYALFAFLCGSGGGTRILDRRVTPEGYNHAQVAASAPGALRSLVPYHLPGPATPTASFRFGIRHLGAGDAEPRAEHRFLLTAWVFLLDHGHAIFYPRRPLTISRVIKAIKDGNGLGGGTLVDRFQIKVEMGSVVARTCCLGPRLSFNPIRTRHRVELQHCFGTTLLAATFS
jgi:hypothetical protein